MTLCHVLPGSGLRHRVRSLAQGKRWWFCLCLTKSIIWSQSFSPAVFRHDLRETSEEMSREHYPEFAAHVYTNAAAVESDQRSSSLFSHQEKKGCREKDLKVWSSMYKFSCYANSNNVPMLLMQIGRKMSKVKRQKNPLRSCPNTRRVKIEVSSESGEKIIPFMIVMINRWRHSGRKETSFLQSSLLLRWINYHWLSHYQIIIMIINRK